mmetsp:Transcript_123075/g.382507  ORF Transcript_123075/g.382507 Transcript_123075/m.382507 type:complete len:203 (+) Transcript_123075:189-797(+)
MPFAGPKRIWRAEIRRPSCPKDLAISSTRSAEMQPLPSVSSSPFGFVAVARAFTSSTIWIAAGSSSTVRSVPERASWKRSANFAMAISPARAAGRCHSRMQCAAAGCSPGPRSAKKIAMMGPPDSSSSHCFDVVFVRLYVRNAKRRPQTSKCSWRRSGTSPWLGTPTKRKRSLPKRWKRRHSLASRRGLSKTTWHGLFSWAA